MNKWHTLHQPCRLRCSTPTPAMHMRLALAVHPHTPSRTSGGMWTVPQRLWHADHSRSQQLP